MWPTTSPVKLGSAHDTCCLFDEAMRTVCEAPERFRVEFPPAIRKYRVPGFPYNILYRIVGSDIEVLVVAAHRRRPGYWLGRL